MLKEFFANQLTLGCAQAAVATLLALAVMLLARQREIHLERETIVALVRGIVQITAVGSILVLLLRGPAWTSVFLLAAMIVAAAECPRAGRKACQKAFKFRSMPSARARVR